MSGAWWRRRQRQTPGKRWSLFCAQGMLLACLCVVFCSSPVTASSFVVGLSALMDSSDAIVVASMGSSSSVWEDSHIVTYWKWVVLERVAGKIQQGQEIWIRTLGGEVGESGQSVSGEPEFFVGEECLLFLRKDKVSGIWTVNRRTQGEYPLVQSAGRVVLRAGEFPGLVQVPVGGSRLGLHPGQGICPSCSLAVESLPGQSLDAVTRMLQEQWKKSHGAP